MDGGGRIENPESRRALQAPSLRVTSLKARLRPQFVSGAPSGDALSFRPEIPEFASSSRFLENSRPLDVARVAG